METLTNPQIINVNFKQETNEIINKIDKIYKPIEPKTQPKVCRNKSHCKMPKDTQFIGSFNRETNQLEGETIKISATEKTKQKILKLRKYAAKRLKLERIHRALKDKIESLRNFSTFLEEI